MADRHIITRQEQYQHHQAHRGSAYATLHRACAPQVARQQAVPKLLPRLVHNTSTVIVAAAGANTAGALHQTAWASDLEKSEGLG